MRIHNLKVLLIPVIFALCCAGQSNLDASNILESILHNAAAGEDGFELGIDGNL